MDELFKTSVTDLMSAFCDALKGLVPVMDRVRIPWHDHDAYDDWDHIAQVLYQEVVIHSLRCSLEVQSQDLKLPALGFMISSYDLFSWIEIAGSGSPPHLIFVDFSTSATAFDSVRVRHMNAYGELQPELTTVPSAGLSFQLRWRQPAREDILLRNLTVQL